MGLEAASSLSGSHLTKANVEVVPTGVLSSAPASGLALLPPFVEGHVTGGVAEGRAVVHGSCLGAGRLGWVREGVRWRVVAGNY